MKLINPLPLIIKQISKIRNFIYFKVDVLLLGKLTSVQKMSLIFSLGHRKMPFGRSSPCRCSMTMHLSYSVHVPVTRSLSDACQLKPDFLHFPKLAAIYCCPLTYQHFFGMWEESRASGGNRQGRCKPHTDKTEGQD